MFLKALAKLQNELEFVDSPAAVLRHSVVDPPVALCVDMLTGIRLGSERAARLFELPVRWPLLRGTITPEGEARYLCLKPYRGGRMLDALPPLVAGERWPDGNSRRRFLRLPIQSRAWIRDADEPQCRRGHVLSLSGGGAHVVSEAALPPVDSRATLELIDLPTGPVRVSGRVVWRRGWEDGPYIPGFGMEFDAEARRGPLAEALLAHPAMGRAYF